MTVKGLAKAMLPIATMPKSARLRGANQESADRGWILPAPRLPSSPLTLGLTLLCVVIALLPDVNAWLQFERASILAGQWWRLITGHFTHWNYEHLAWDVLMFYVLGSMFERRDVCRYLTVLGATSVVIALGVLALAPRLQTYRGLSGIDTALFASFSVIVLQAAHRQKKRGTTMLVTALLLLLAAKVAFETVSSRAIFVDAAAAGFRPLPLAHVLGIAAGMTVGFWIPPRNGAFAWIAHMKTN